MSITFNERIISTIKFFSENSLGDNKTIKAFMDRVKQGPPFTKQDGSSEHINAFFLPYHKDSHQIFLGHHKKADDWIPPGGHIDSGESPKQAAVREISEELRVKASEDQLEPFYLSIKEINRPENGCQTHFDIWYLFNTPPIDFNYLENEYYDARWFKIEDGLKMIKKNPDFKKIIARLKK